MESLSGTAVSSTVAIVGSIWPKGPAQAGPATQAQWSVLLIGKVNKRAFTAGKQ